MSGDIARFTHELKQHDGQDIWLVGGGQINMVMLNAGLIDEMVVAVILYGPGPMANGEAVAERGQPESLLCPT